MNRVTYQYDGVNATPTVFGHDALFETDITDANGNNYHTDYNALGWPTRTCDPLSLCSTARYDRNGQLTSTTNRRGQIVSLTRDVLGRITQKSGTNTTQVNFSYAVNDRDYVASTASEIDSVFSYPGSSTARARDSVVKRVGPYRFVVTHIAPFEMDDTATTTIATNTPASFNSRRVFYSTAGTPDSLNAGFGSISFDFLRDGSLRGIHYPDGTVIESRITAAHMPRISGSVSGTLGTSYNREYHYQTNGMRIDQMTNPVTATQFKYQYDPLGRLMSREARTACSLSSNDGLTGDASGLGDNCPTLQSTESFGYDAVGNRTDHSAVIGSANRYQSFDGMTMAHDADGNVIQRYDPSRFNRQYFWSADGLLTSVLQDGWSNVSYDYNAFGQPVIKHRSDPNNSGYIDAYYIWDGDQLLAELDGNGNRRSDYVYMPGAIDQPLAQTLGATTPSSMRFHQLDGLGNVIGTFLSGAVTKTVDFVSWGVPTVQGSGENRLLWKGLMYEGDIVSLYFVRNRWYDPAIGRFMSEDPAKQYGGVNLYAFSGNDPIDGQDPSGLCDVDVGMWIDFVLRSPSQGTFSHTCQDLPPVIVTASTGRFGEYFGAAGRNTYGSNSLEYTGFGIAAVGAIGPTLGVGSYSTASGEEGLYLKTGLGFGVAAGAGVEGGKARSRNAFQSGIALCGSALVVGLCIPLEPSGATGYGASITAGLSAGGYAEISRTLLVPSPIRALLQTRFFREARQFMTAPYGMPR
jgi:RHS repeat-associated protein